MDGVSAHQWWTYKLIAHFSTINNAAMNIHIQVFALKYFSRSLGFLPGMDCFLMILFIFGRKGF